MIIRKIHQWLGLVLGVPLIIIGLSGSIYTWQPELTKLMYNDLYSAQETTENLTPLEISSLLEKRSNKKIDTFYFPERERETFIVRFYNEELYHFINPKDGKELGQMDSRRGVFDSLLKLHMSFFVDGGKYFVAWIALITSILLFTSGIYLWYPKCRKFKKRDFWNWVSIKKKSFAISWHMMIGIYVSIFVIILGLSGPYFTFKKQYVSVLSVLTMTESDKPLEVKSKGSGDVLNIQQTMMEMNKYFTSYYPRSIHLTQDSEKTIYLSWMKDKTLHAGKRERAYMNVDIYSGEPIFVFNPDKASAVDAITNKWIAPIHFGELGGLIHRVVNSLAGLGLALLSILGWMLYYKR